MLLYSRGFVKEGDEVLSSLYRMGTHTEVAKIYPGLPEYFNGEGRGLYPYLTGSASWFLLTWVTQVLGIRGEWGDSAFGTEAHAGTIRPLRTSCGACGVRWKNRFI